MAVAGATVKLSSSVSELTKKNEEYSKMVHKLMNAVKQEKLKHEKTINEAENQLKDVQEQYRAEKEELISINAELENKLKNLSDSTQHLEGDPKIVLHLEKRLAKASAELESKTRVLAEIEDEKKNLLSVNQSLEQILSEHRETTQNFRLVMENEVSELRNRLRAAEEKTLDIINRKVDQILPGQQSRHPAICSGGEELIVVGDCRPMRWHSLSRDRSRCNSRGCSPSSTYRVVHIDDLPDRNMLDEDDREDTPEVGSLNSSPASEQILNQSLRYIRRSSNHYREILCLLMAATILILSYCIHSLDTGCRYQTLPYSPPSSIEYSTWATPINR